MANGTGGDRIRQSKPRRFSAVIGQMAVLISYMYCDGSAAFERLSGTSRTALQRSQASPRSVLLSRTSS